MTILSPSHAVVIGSIESHDQ